MRIFDHAWPHTRSAQRVRNRSLPAPIQVSLFLILRNLRVFPYLADPEYDPQDLCKPFTNIIGKPSVGVREERPVSSPKRTKIEPVPRTALESIALLVGKSEAAAGSELNDSELAALVQNKLPELLVNHTNLYKLAASLTSPWGKLIHTITSILSAPTAHSRVDLRNDLQMAIETVLCKADPSELFVWKLDVQDANLDQSLEQRKNILSKNILQWIGIDFFDIVGEVAMNPQNIIPEYWQELLGKFYSKIDPDHPKAKQTRMMILAKLRNVFPFLQLQDRLFPQPAIDYSQAVPSLSVPADTAKADLGGCLAIVEKSQLSPEIKQAVCELLNSWDREGLFPYTTTKDLKRELAALSVNTTTVLLIVKNLVEKKIIKG